MKHWVHFYSWDGFPVPAWDIANQIVGDGYIPYSTEKNGRAAGRHVMDDFGSLVQALPQDHLLLSEEEKRLWHHQNWGPMTSDGDVYFYH